MDQRKALPHLPPVLRAMAEEGRLVHSLCLEGEPGSGRTDLATALAGAILCQRQQGEMCGECLHCRKVLAGVHSDITLVNGREDPDRFKVEALRQLRAEAHRGPSEGRAKVYILAEAQHLLPPAQNLLLKILEEPPEATFFILTCDNKFRLLPTILSRVVTVSLRPLPLEACAQLLEERLPGHALAEYREAALLCCGNPGEGEQILTQPQAAKKGRAAQSLVAAMAAVPEAVKLCMVQIIAVDSKFGPEAQVNSPVVASYNTDGYSESYGGVEAQMEAATRSVDAAIREMLYGEEDDRGVPLLYRGLDL